MVVTAGDGANRPAENVDNVQRQWGRQRNRAIKEGGSPWRFRVKGQRAAVRRRPASSMPCGEW